MPSEFETARLFPTSTAGGVAGGVGESLGKGGLELLSWSRCGEGTSSLSPTVPHIPLPAPTAAEEQGPHRAA